MYNFTDGSVCSTRDNVPEEEAGTGAAAPQGGPAHNEPPIIGLEFSGPREIKQCVNCVNNIYWSLIDRYDRKWNHIFKMIMGKSLYLA